MTLTALILKKKRHDPTYYYKNRENNQDGNQEIDNKPEWKNKREINEDSSNKFPLFVISSGIFK